MKNLKIGILINSIKWGGEGVDVSEMKNNDTTRKKEVLRFSESLRTIL